MPTDDELIARGIMDLSAARLYLAALELNLDTSKVLISKADILRLEVEDPIVATVEARYQEYRDLFKGVKSQAMGDKNNVIRHLIRFMRETEKTFDEVLELAREYVFSNLGNPYIRRADYVLYKWERGIEVQTLKEYEQSKETHRSKLI